MTTPDGCDRVVDLGCAAGSGPRLDDGRCHPVGDAACGAGFEPDASGWGCAPVLPPAAAACAGATRAALGAPRCVLVGACAAVPAAAGSTVVVDPSGPEDANHARTIASAVAKAPVGGLVALAPGRYVERVALARAVTIAGTCAAEVSIESPDGSAAGVAASAEGTIRGVTLRGHRVGVDVAPGARVELEDAVLDANLEAGVRVASGATLVARRSVARGTLAVGGRSGHGVWGLAGARVTLDDVTLSANVEGALRLDRGATASLVRVVALDTKPNAAGRGGIGLMSLDATDVRATACAFVRNAEAGVLAEQRPGQPPAKVVLEGSFVGDTAPWPTAFEARGEYAGWNVAARGAELVLRRSTVARARGLAVLSSYGARVVLEDATVREALPNPGGVGKGLVGAQDASVSLTRTAVVGSVGPAVFVGGAGGRATLEGSLVRDVTGSAPGRRDASAVEAAGGAEVEVRDSSVARFAGMGVRVASLVGLPDGGRATVERSIVAEGVGYDDGTFGRGVEADLGEVRLAGSLVDGAREGAVVATSGSTVKVEGSVLRGTRPNAAGFGGRGVQVQRGAFVELVDSVVRGSRDVGVFVGQEGSRATLLRTHVVGTRLAEAEANFGFGLAVLLGGHALLDGAYVARSEGVGLVVADGAALVRGGVFGENPVALHAAGDATLVEVGDDVDATAPNELRVSRATRFDGNGARAGRGQIALPRVDLDPAE